MKAMRECIDLLRVGFEGMGKMRRELRLAAGGGRATLMA